MVSFITVNGFVKIPFGNFIWTFHEDTIGFYNFEDASHNQTFIHYTTIISLPTARQRIPPSPPLPLSPSEKREISG